MVCSAIGWLPRKIQMIEDWNPPENPWSLSPKKGLEWFFISRSQDIQGLWFPWFKPKI
jgi:hypothetical protein